jgi:flagellin
MRPDFQKGRSMLSVNTNGGALAALQSLSQTNRELQVTQGRINTGLKVANAVDNGAVFAIAEAQRTRVDALGAVKGGIDRAKSAIDFGVKAGEAVNEILKQMRAKAQEATGTGLADSDRAKLDTDFQKLADQIDQIVGAAAYNGTNLASGNASVSVLTADTGSTSSGRFVAASRLTGSGVNLNDATAGQRLVSKNATLSSIDAGLTDDTTETLTFTQTVGNATNTYAVTLQSTDTVESLVNKINTATDGAINARFDADRGEIVYSSAADFTIAMDDGATDIATASTEAFLEGTGAAEDVSTVQDDATSQGVANQYGGGVNAGASITVAGGDFRRATLGLSSVSVTGATSANASNAISAIDTALNTLRTSLSSLGSQSKALGVQSTFLTQLSDTLKGSIGNLVDADLAEESARLQSLQVKQQLGAQALSIANQSPQIILSFFR